MDEMTNESPVFYRPSSPSVPVPKNDLRISASHFIPQGKGVAIMDTESPRTRPDTRAKTATPVAWGWAGAIFEVTYSFGEEQ